MRVWLHVRLQQRRVPAVSARQLPAPVGADQVRRGRNTCPAVYNCTRATCCCLLILTVHVCSCWPCPANTTTDGPGAASLDMCKSPSCPFYAKEGVGIMESPNYPRQFPVITVKILCFATKILRQTGAECRWRVSPGHTRRVLLILPRLALPPDCSASFTVSRWGSHYSAAVFRE